MFKLSFNMVKEICGFDITENEFFEILNLQGFEVDEKTKKDNDIIITIEVKANRPDMLCHLGIAREICAFKGVKIPEIPKCERLVSKVKFPIDVVIDSGTSKRFSSLIIEGINNNVETPNYIKDLLEKLGINSVNAVVDIANYVMLKYGQPMHTYDKDRINGNNIYVKRAEKECKVNTLAGIETEIKKDDIIICDKNEILCVAGIIGTDRSSVEKDTKNVMLEAACFDAVSVRLTSRRMRISTPSSFMFERGINTDKCMDILNICARMIAKICGGKIKEGTFDFYPDKKDNDKINLRISRTNLVIGMKFSADKIIEYLVKYDFKCKIKDNDNIIVTIPDYRLDVKKEVDLIEEVARIHGYDNIPSVMPTVKSHYEPNKIWQNSDDLRNIFVNLGFYEVITYSFIPLNFMDIFKIKEGSRLYSDIILKNPLSREYALMRPTLVYSLLSSLAYNYSMNNTNLALFEIGRVYFKDEESKSGYGETDTFAFIFSGIRLSRGFGIDKDIKYSYYDLLNYINIIFNKFGQEFKLEKGNYQFCEEGSGYNIISKGKVIGFIGELNKKVISKVQNVKLIKDPIFYCELYIKELDEHRKKLKFESKYPSIKRLYNFMVNKNIKSSDIENIIRSSSEIIRDVKVCDIYSNKKMDQNQHAILYEVNYCSKESTLVSEQIEQIENEFTNKLSMSLGVVIKA